MMKSQLDMPVSAMNYPVALLRSLSLKGISKFDALKNSGLSENSLTDFDRLISKEEALILVENAITSTADCNVGLDVGSQLYVNSHGVLGMAILSSKTLDDVFSIIQRYLCIQFPNCNITFSRNREGVNLNIPKVENSELKTKFLVDAVFSTVYSTLKLLTGENNPQVRFELTADRTENDEKYTRCLGDNVAFEMSSNRLSISNAVLNTSLKFYDPISLELSLKQCEELLTKVNGRRKMQRRVIDVINNMSCPFPDIEAVSNKLYMCSRTLRRKLKAEGLTYQGILDNKRKCIAIKYLTETEMSITQISTELDFSDSSYFSRAFKRWTGVLPKTYRQTVLGGNS